MFLDNEPLAPDAAESVGVPETAKPDRLIYCGPNIPGGVLQRYTIYKNGMPLHLGELFKKCPAAVKLFVPVADLVKTERAISTKGTPEHSAFQEVLQYIVKGGV